MTKLPSDEYRCTRLSLTWPSLGRTDDDSSVGAPSAARSIRAPANQRTALAAQRLYARSSCSPVARVSIHLAPLVRRESCYHSSLCSRPLPKRGPIES